MATAWCRTPDMATVQTLQQCTTGPDIGISPALYRCISPNCLFRCPHSGTRQHTWATGLLVKHFDQKQSLFQKYCVVITFVYFGACLGCLVLIILHTLFAYSERGNQPLELILDYSWNITTSQTFVKHHTTHVSSALVFCLIFWKWQLLISEFHNRFGSEFNICPHQ